MGGVILENLSGRKLAVLVISLLILQVVCFVIGGIFAPHPTYVEPVLATKCHFNETINKENDFVYPRAHGKENCDVIYDLQGDDVTQKHITADQVVFAFQLPLPKGGQDLDYTRWQQNLIAVLQIDALFSSHDEVRLATNSTLTMDVRVGYRNRWEDEREWHLWARSEVRRQMDCTIEKEVEGYMYSCPMMPLFELGSLYHDYYLINIRLPTSGQRNSNVGTIKDLWLVTIIQNGGFTKVWMSMKAIFFPCIIAIMSWYWNRIRMLPRSPVLIEKMLFVLGLALTQLNMPIEFFTLWLDMPYMLLVSDIRQGIFYATLLSFWLVFAGEHMMVDEQNRNRLNIYWKHLSAVVIGCLCLLVFDMCERGVQLSNPFYSIWVSDLGMNLALSFIILAAVSACCYFLFLCYMIFKVFKNISFKRTSLPNMSNARRLFYEGVIYRFKFLMLATLLCAAMTVISYIIGQVSEGHWKWDDNIQLDYTSAVFCGVYGMWNIYVFALIVLYAPSHKRWPTSDNDPRASSTEEIEFSRLPTEPTEATSFASFTRKATID